MNRNITQSLIFTTLVLGLSYMVFMGPWYLEPFAEFRYRPVNTNVPGSFQEVENNLSNYSLFSPNLYFGYRF